MLSPHCLHDNHDCCSGLVSLDVRKIACTCQCHDVARGVGRVFKPDEPDEPMVCLELEEAA